MADKRTLKPRTLAAQALGAIDSETKAVVPPLHLSTTYIRDPDNYLIEVGESEPGGVIYERTTASITR